MENQKCNSKNPFGGTILASSYISVLLKDSDESNSSTNLFNPPSSILAESLIGVNNLVVPAVRSGIDWHYVGTSFIKLLWEFVKDSISTITKRKKLNEIKGTFNKFIIKSNTCFDDYKIKHEDLLQKSVADTDNINRSKTLMKDYLLSKLFKKLQVMGISSNYTDLHVEHLDLRDFPINENYDLVKQQQLNFVKITNSTLEDICALHPLYLLFFRFVNEKSIKIIQEKLQEMQKIQEYNESKMNSDLKKLGMFESALKNVSSIYSDLLKVLMPIMEKLLTELTYKFNDDFSNMPTEKIETIRNVKDILKDLSEVKVLPQSSFDDAVSNVVEYSNNLSVRHCKLKEQILKMAV